jgi:hypothetical protein
MELKILSKSFGEEIITEHIDKETDNTIPSIHQFPQRKVFKVVIMYKTSQDTTKPLPEKVSKPS